MLTDAHSWMKGVDGYTDPELLSVSSIQQCIGAVNRTFRGYVNASRPKFIHMRVSFSDERAKLAFETGAVIGSHPYRKKSKATRPYLIVCVGGCILAGRVNGGEVTFRTIYSDVSLTTKKMFFVQAETILVCGDGENSNLYWDGLMETMKVAEEVPTLGMMCYAHGRIFGVNPDGYVYASDHIYSYKIDQTASGVLRFQESTYPFSGDGFGSPGDLDEVTGISVTKQSSQINGHGPVIVFCRNGAYSINAALPRPTWTDDRNIQTIVLAGRGCSSPSSVIQINNDLWYRCSDGSVSSLRNAYSSESDQWSESSLSKEVAKYLGYDDDVSSGLSASMFFDNRLIISCAFSEKEVGDGQVHRYANGMVVADFDTGSLTSRDSAISWDGLWTGPRVTAFSKLYTDGIDRAFVLSYDHDGVNRIYELSKSSGDDIGENGEIPVKWNYSFCALFGKDRRFVVKKIEAALAVFSDASPEFSMNLWASSGFGYPLMQMQQKESGLSAPKVIEQDPCSPGIVGEYSGYKAFFGICNPESKHGHLFRGDHGTEFIFTVEGIGAASIRRFYAAAREVETIKPETMLFSSKCPIIKTSKCPESVENFSYKMQ